MITTVQATPNDRREKSDRRQRNDRRKHGDRRKTADILNHKAVIMLVDDSPINLIIGKNVLSEHYSVATVPSAEKMFGRLKTKSPDMILLDIDMPGMSGYEAIILLKSKPETKDIPVIFLSARSEAVDELKGLCLGAIDYIIKPYHPSILLKRIEIRLRG